MREPSKIAFNISFPFAMLVGFGQNTSWLQRSWKEQAFILINGPKKLRLVLTIGKIKGKTFEGI